MLCRLCVIECNDFLDVFEKDGLKHELWMLISRYLQIQVNEDDEHSTSICKTCFETLTTFHYFCQSVEIAQKKWEIVPNLNFVKEDDIVFEDVCEESFIDNYYEPIKIKNVEHGFYENSILDKIEDVNVEHSPTNSDEDIVNSTTNNRLKSKKTLLSEENNKLIESHTKLFCNECNETMASFKDLKKHFKDDHLKPGYMICCKRKFFRAADLADHIHVHLNPEYFRCALCDKSFSGRYTLDFHTKTSHIEDESKKNYFHCIECPKKFLRKCILEKHQLTHRKQIVDPGEHVCAECGKGYATESKLKTHHFNVHTLIYSRICHVCGKIVRGNKALELHQLEHAGFKQKVKCEVCGVELSTKGILKAHMIALHPEDTSETHTCTICGKNAPSKRALKYHTDYVHKSERSHTCSLCEKSFKKLQALKEHITTHTGDRLYECPHCTKTFKVRSNMHQHRKAKHPREFEESRKNRTRRK